MVHYTHLAKIKAHYTHPQAYMQNLNIKKMMNTRKVSYENTNIKLYKSKEGKTFCLKLSGERQKKRREKKEKKKKEV